MDIDKVRTFVDFKVIEIVDDIFLYPALLIIYWSFNNSTVFDLNKRRMMLEVDGIRVIGPRDMDEGCRYSEPIKEEDNAYELENI
jgi:hypothetical protein